ncbi:MAG: glycosyltransferase family 2 protein [Bdellovibrionota bacterium]
MHQAPTVSIVLPTHNGAHFLAESVRSVVEQTYRDWELIIVDDASSDGTPALIADWMARDDRIRSLHNPVNLRLPASLNRGFAEARGTYLTWTSDDNLYRPHAIERMLEVLEGHPECGMVYTDFSEIDEEGKITKAIRVRESRRLLSGNCVRASFLYRAEAAKLVGNYREDLFLAEDWDYWLRIVERFPVRALHEDCYLYRWHARSLSLSRAAQVRGVCERLLNEHLSKAQWAAKKDRAEAYLRLVEIAENDGDDMRAYKYWRSVFACSPSIALRCRRYAVSLLLGRRLGRRLRRWWRPPTSSASLEGQPFGS